MFFLSPIGNYVMKVKSLSSLITHAGIYEWVFGTNDTYLVYVLNQINITIEKV